jgi:2-hydroxychromene-2-carboxylate isomerase
VFGVTTFFVGDEMFWGNDRLHFVEAVAFNASLVSPAGPE